MTQKNTIQIYVFVFIIFNLVYFFPSAVHYGEKAEVIYESFYW
jgi:hypothetical protein